MLSSTLDFAKGLVELKHFGCLDLAKGLNLGHSDAWSLCSLNSVPLKTKALELRSPGTFAHFQLNWDG